MKRTVCICVLLLTAFHVFAGDVPQLTVSTTRKAPPEYRSFQLTTAFKRGSKDILVDEKNGRHESEASRSQYVVHDGKTVCTIRRPGGTGYTKLSNATSIDVEEIDLTLDGVPDLVLLLKEGAPEVLEAYLIQPDRFLLPVPSNVLFNDQGEHRSYQDVMSEAKKHIGQQSSAGDSSTRAARVSEPPEK